MKETFKRAISLGSQWSIGAAVIVLLTAPMLDYQTRLSETGLNVVLTGSNDAQFVATFLQARESVPLPWLLRVYRSLSRSGRQMPRHPATPSLTREI